MLPACGRDDGGERTGVVVVGGGKRGEERWWVGGIVTGSRGWSGVEGERRRSACGMTSFSVGGFGYVRQMIRRRNGCEYYDGDVCFLALNSFRSSPFACFTSGSLTAIIVINLLSLFSQPPPSSVSPSSPPHLPLRPLNPPTPLPNPSQNLLTMPSQHPRHTILLTPHHIAIPFARPFCGPGLPVRMRGADQDERVVLVPAAQVERVESIVLDGQDGACVRCGGRGGVGGGG